MIPSDFLSLILEAQNGGQHSLTRIIEENSGLIWSVVRRYQGRNVELDDLYQLGSLGFLKAVNGFDPSFGTQFSTYAVPKIAGEIRRFLRDDGMVKVSRSVKEQAYLVQQTRLRLQDSLKREPSLSEVAENCGLEVEEIASLDLATASVSSLQADSGESELPLEARLGCDGPEEALVEKVDLHNAIGTLSEREQTVIFLRYYKGLTQEKIARIVGVSQVQVSRVEKKALLSLQKLLLEAYS